MKLRVFFLLILFSASFNLNAGNYETLDFSINELTIYGKSNFNNFSFVLNDDPHEISDKKIIIEKNNTRTTFLIPVNRLKTSNKYIQNDFFKMIKADVFPYIKLSVENNQFEAIASGGKCETISALITIDKESKLYTIPINKGFNLINDQFILGNIELLLSDFNLEPISKFFGLVKVENNIVIDFRINFSLS